MMQSREARIVLYGICTVFCFYHSVSAVVDLLHPETSAQLIEAMGSTGFYAMTVVRLIALVWAGVAFGRMAYKAFQEKSK